MMAPEAKKLSILEFNTPAMLRELNMDQNQFIDMCILCGCDYSRTIRGVGPKKAYQGISKYGSIEAFVASLDRAKCVTC
jgi:flap endonuclease-1